MNSKPNETDTSINKFSAVIVGAGPAGTATAYTLAKSGVRCALIERGAYPGSKNVMGGVLYTQPVSNVIPNFWEEAPLERHLVQQEFWTLSEDAVITLKHQSAKFLEKPYNRYTVLRAKFDPWFAKQAEEAGAYLINKTMVEELIKENGKVVGVRTDRPDGDLYADCVIIADGVNSILARKAGLGSEIKTKHVALSVKEIISLPEEKICDRFNLEGNEGAAVDLYGNVARGLAASGFIYTNRNSLSVGIGVMLDDLVKSKSKPYELLEEMKNHIAIRKLLKGGEPREYMAHMIPEGGYNAMPNLYDAGVLVVGDAAMMVNGIHREGSNLAVTSGKIAAETVIKAIENNDFSKAMMANYEKALSNSFVLKDLKKYKDFPAFASSHHQIFSLLPQVINDAASEFLTVKNVPKTVQQKGLVKRIRERISFFRMLKDLYDGWRAVR